MPMTENEAASLLDAEFATQMDKAGYKNSIGWHSAFGNGHPQLRTAAIAAVLRAANSQPQT